MTSARFWLLVGGVMTLTTMAYFPAFSAPYYFDDFSLFSDPAMLPGGANRVLDFARTRTLTYLSFLATFRGGGQNPSFDHLVNFVIFLALVALAAGLYRKLIGARGALVAAALVALHPLATEAVVYVFARATLLAALLSMAAWVAWLHQRHWTAVLFAALAMAAKEEAVVLPLFLGCFELLYQHAPFRELKKLVIPLSAMAAFSVFFAGRVIYAAQVTPAAGALGGIEELTPFSYLQAQGRALWLYAKLLVFPLGLNFDHDITVRQSLDPLALLGCFSIAALALCCLFWSRQKPWLFFPIGALILLAPTSSIAPLADIAAERRMLLPLFCLAPLAGIFAERLLPGRRLPIAAALLACIVGSLTYQRVLQWNNAEVLWSDTVSKSPQKARPKLHLARALEARGAITEPAREQLLHQATDVEPRSAGAWGELGLFQLRRQRLSDATAALRRAYELVPDDPGLAANLGVALAASGQNNEAEALFRRALEISPCNFDARNNLLFILRTRGDLESARASTLPPADCVFPPGQREALVRAAEL